MDEKGKRIAPEGQTLSDDFIEGAQGRWFHFTEVDGSTQWYHLKLYLIIACGDYPQLQAMGPWMEAVQAYCPCRGCNYRVDNSMRHESVHSFFDADATWKLRDSRGVLAQINKWRSQPHSRAGKEMQNAGINKLHWLLSDKYFPHINFISVSPQDIMHDLAEGITRHEAAWLLYMLHSRHHLSLSKVNDAIRKYTWPRDGRVPPIPSCVMDGNTGRYPRTESTLHMSASQTFTFTIHRHTLTVFELQARRPLLTPCASACVPQHRASHPITRRSSNADSVLALMGGACAYGGDGAAFYFLCGRCRGAG